MSDQIFNDTTVEVNPDDANEAPVIPLIDLASESGSDNVEILDVVTSTTTTPGRSSRQVYNEWSRGLATTSTPNDLARARRGEVQAEHLRCLAQENDRFYTMFGQPDMSTPDQALPWPENLTRSQLRETYARAYAVLESEFPELLELENCDFPHPTAFDSDTQGSEGDDSDVVAVIPRDPRDSTTTNTVDSAPEALEEPVGFDPMGPVMGPVYQSYFRPKSGYRSPTWPPLPLWQWASGRPIQEVRPGPIPNTRFNPVPNDRFNPVPSTSSGVTRPVCQGSELGLVPMNQEARKLLEKGFLTEVAIGKILADKAEMSGDDRKAAEAFNEALKIKNWKARQIS